MTLTKYVIAKDEREACYFASLGATYNTYNEANEHMNEVDFEINNIYEVKVIYSAHLPGEE